jgi:hypothetical protein
MEVILGRVASPCFDEEGGRSGPVASGVPACWHVAGVTTNDRGVRSSTVHVVDNAAVREHRPERFSSPRQAARRS